MVGVVVVDHRAPFRRAATTVLGAMEGFELLAEACSGEQAVLARSQRSRPDLVLMDVRMPGVGGIEATRRIVATGARTVVVLVSTHREERLARRCQRAVRSGGVPPQGRKRAAICSRRSGAGQHP